MSPPPLHVLTEAEKNELLLAQHEMIERNCSRGWQKSVARRSIG